MSQRALPTVAIGRRPKRKRHPNYRLVKIHRSYKAKGRSQSYVAARCADGRLQARGSVSFTDGSSLTGSIFRTCRARG